MLLPPSVRSPATRSTLGFVLKQGGGCILPALGGSLSKGALTLTFCSLLVASAALVAARPQGQASDHRAVLNQYCVTCHNETAKTAGLALDKMDLSAIGSNAAVWEKVVGKLRSGMMPPQGALRPDDATRSTLVSWLTTELDRASAAKPNPGRPLMSRLNRTQYANVIRDLLSLEVDPVCSLAARRCGIRFRQCRRCARNFAGVARTLYGCGWKGQRARHRRPGHRSRAAKRSASGRMLLRTFTSRECRSAPSAGSSPK